LKPDLPAYEQGTQRVDAHGLHADGTSPVDGQETLTGPTERLTESNASLNLSLFVTNLAPVEHPPSQPWVLVQAAEEK